MSEFEQGTPKPPDKTEPGSQLSLWPPEAGEAPATAPPAEHPASEPRALASGQFPAPTVPVESPAEPEAPPWSLTDLGAFVLFVAVSFLAVSLTVTGVFLGLRGAFGWEMTVGQAFAQTPVVVSFQTGWEILWLGFIYFTITVKYRRRFWDAIQWTRAARDDIHLSFRPRTWVAAGAVLALLAQLIFFLAPTEHELPIERLFTSPGAGYLLAVFGIGVAPFVEELVFRGFFYPVFERRWGLATAVLLTAFLFAVIHASQLWGGWQEIAAIFFVGAVFSYSRGKTGSLVPAYLMHLGYNTMLFVLMYFSTDGFRTLQD